MYIYMNDCICVYVYMTVKIVLVSLRALRNEICFRCVLRSVHKQEPCFTCSLSRRIFNFCDV